MTINVRRLTARVLALAALFVIAGFADPTPAQQAGAAFRGTGTIVAVQARRVETPASWYLESADGKRTTILQCGHVDYMKYLRQEVEIEATWYQTAGICIDKLTTVAELKAADAKRAADAKAAQDKQAAELERQREAETRPARRKAIAQKYAPLVYLHKGELWLPSSIDYFAGYMRSMCGGRPGAEDLFALNGIMILPADQCTFATKKPLSGPYDQPAWLRGQDPSKTSVPIYVFIYPDERTDATDPTHTSFYAQYMTFYPYNFGKNACIGVAPSDECVGKRMMMAHHVADWELTTVRFRQGKPVAVHVGAHGNDIPDTAYTFRAPAWTDSGRAPQPGQSVLQWEGDHPVVYSAEGSHGIYGWEGAHNYKTTKVGDRLIDYTSKGTRWEAWKNIVWADEPRYSFLLNGYDGRWGNLHMGKSACELAPVPESTCGYAGIPTDEYQLNDGPSLPNRQRDKEYMD